MHYYYSSADEPFLGPLVPLLIFCAPHFNFMELKWGPKRKVGAPKNFFRRFAPEMGPHFQFASYTPGQSVVSASQALSWPAIFRNEEGTRRRCRMEWGMQLQTRSGDETLRLFVRLSVCSFCSSVTVLQVQPLSSSNFELRQPCFCRPFHSLILLLRYNLQDSRHVN